LRVEGRSELAHGSVVELLEEEVVFLRREEVEGISSGLQAQTIRREMLDALTA
jgi:hypothetical protein